MISRRGLAFGAAGLALAPRAPSAQTRIEQPDVRLAVGGQALLYYLPLTLAQSLGYFSDAGLRVQINDFSGGSKSLQALMGGSVDVVTGAYDHTIQLQAKGQELTALVVLGRYPGISLGVVKRRVADYRGPESLKGWKVGVTAPGSSTSFFVNYLLSHHGLAPSDVAQIGVGGGSTAVAAVRRGELDAISNVDPAITLLESTGEIEVVVDTRTEAGSREAFGGGYPAAVLYAKPAFIADHPGTIQALVTAFVRTLRWLESASVDQIVERVPEAYLLGDRKVYVEALRHSRAMYSPDGELDMAAAHNALEVLSAFDQGVRQDAIDLTRTWDGRFVAEARKRLDG